MTKNKNKSRQTNQKEKSLLDDESIDYEQLTVSELYSIISNRPDNYSDDDLEKHPAYIQLKKLYSGRTKP